MNGIIRLHEISVKCTFNYEKKKHILRPTIAVRFELYCDLTDKLLQNVVNAYNHVFLGKLINHFQNSF